MRNGLRGGTNFCATSHPWSLLRMTRQVFLTGFLLTVTCIVGTLWSMVGAVYGESGNPPKQTQVQTDLQRLEGRWVRPDGGYILELSEIKKGGSVSAAYFNPRPIKVFSERWSRKGGKINLFVDLRDVNYPGSKYNL
jgi:hypothetical protein